MRFRKWDRIWICKNRELTGLADCHLHFEGSLPADVVEELARRAGDPLGEPGALAARRASVTDSAGFLALFADVCRLFRSPEDYSGAAARLSRALAKDGVAYAEGARVAGDLPARSASIPRRRSKPWMPALRRRRRAGCDCRILLDTVRQWGPESAGRVLDLHERRPRDRVVGFGMGGRRKARFPQRPSPVPTPARGRWD